MVDYKKNKSLDKAPYLQANIDEYIEILGYIDMRVSYISFNFDRLIVLLKIQSM